MSVCQRINFWTYCSDRITIAYSRHKLISQIQVLVGLNFLFVKGIRTNVFFLVAVRYFTESCRIIGDFACRWCARFILNYLDLRICNKLLFYTPNIIFWFFFMLNAYLDIILKLLVHSFTAYVLIAPEYWLSRLNLCNYLKFGR